MKYILVTLIIILFFNSAILAQAETNLVFSFRPAITASALKTEPVEILPNSSYGINKTKFTSFEFLLNVEMFTNKGIYHYPVLGWSYTKRDNSFDTYSIGVLTREEKNLLIISDFSVGYGVGKYFFIHKKNIFLNFRNSLAFNYSFTNSKTTEDYIDPFDMQKRTGSISISPPPTFGLSYELNPAIGYRVKWFSVSVGVPLNFGLNMVNGNEKRTRSFYNSTTMTQVVDVNEEKRSSTAFSFNYDLELSLRFHLPHKKKEIK